MAEKLDRLLDWAKSHGCKINPKVNFIYGENGTTVVTTDKIPENEPIASCVESMVMGPNIVTEKTTISDPSLLQIAIKFALVREKLLGENSKYKAYIDILPTADELPLPCYYSEQDKSHLENTNLGADLPLRLSRFQDEYNRGTKELGYNQYTFDDYHWACNIFSSRSFPARLLYKGIDEVISILVPVIDALNHKPLEPVNWNTDGEKEFVLSIGKDLPACQEVFNNYGAKGNEELFFSYGFCIPDNEFDTVALKLGALPPELEEFPKLYHLSDFDPVPDALVRVFQELAMINGHYKIAKIAGIEMLRPSLMAKYTKLKEHLDRILDADSSGIKGPTRIYIDGQLRVYKHALKQCSRIIGDICRHRGYTQLNLDNLPDSFMQSLMPLFGAESRDELIGMEVEEQVLIIYICLSDSILKYYTPSMKELQLDSGSYQEMLDDMVIPLCKALPDVFKPDLLTLDRLALAGDMLEHQGYVFHDPRERFCVIV